MNGLVWVESVFRYSSVSISEVLNLIGFRSVCRFLFEMPPFPPPENEIYSTPSVNTARTYSNQTIAEFVIEWFELEGIDRIKRGTFANGFTDIFNYLQLKTGYVQQGENQILKMNNLIVTNKHIRKSGILVIYNLELHKNKFHYEKHNASIFNLNYFNFFRLWSVS